MKAFNWSVMDFCNKGRFDMTPHCDVSDAMTPISSKWGQVARLKKLMNTFTKLIRPFPDLVNAKKPFSSQFSQLRLVSTQKQKKSITLNLISNFSKWSGKWYFDKIDCQWNYIVQQWLASTAAAHRSSTASFEWECRRGFQGPKNCSA